VFMWLLYLRYDDGGQVKTYHVRTYNKTTVADLIARAERHGLTPTARLVEYAAFIVSGTIKLKPMIVPNFHFYLHEDFVEHWTAADAQAARA
ncbi:MAG: hypothetical protein ACJ8CR_19300, partial [Roseiflexaceae bacterium]